MRLVLRQLLSALANAAARASQTNPITVFVLLLLAIVLLVLVAMILRHKYRLRQLQSEDQRAVLHALERLDLKPFASVEGLRLLSWFRRGGGR